MSKQYRIKTANGYFFLVGTYRKYGRVTGTQDEAEVMNEQDAKNLLETLKGPYLELNHEYANQIVMEEVV